MKKLLMILLIGLFVALSGCYNAPTMTPEDLSGADYLFQSDSLTIGIYTSKEGVGKQLWVPALFINEGKKPIKIDLATENMKVIANGGEYNLDYYIISDEQKSVSLNPSTSQHVTFYLKDGDLIDESGIEYFKIHQIKILPW